MQFKWLIFFIVGFLLALSMEAIAYSYKHKYNGGHVVKTNPRCPTGTRLVSNVCRKIVKN